MVQRPADRQLGQCEGEQVGASQQADPERGQPEILNQIRSDDRGDRAKQPGDEVPECERDEDPNPEPEARAGSRTARLPYSGVFVPRAAGGREERVNMVYRIPSLSPRRSFVRLSARRRARVASRLAIPIQTS